MVETSPEFILVSASCGEDKSKVIEECANAIKDYAGVYRFNVPDLKVGTLDTLVGLSDDMVKYDAYIEGVVRRIVRLIYEAFEHNQEKVSEALRINDVTIDEYTRKFRWDPARYPVKQSLRNIIDVILKVVSQIEGDLKAKSTHYLTIRSNLTAAVKRHSGSLITRSLNDIVEKAHFVLNSEYLVTLFAIVPRSLFNAWWSNYETISKFVVPRTSQLIKEDNENGLFSVVVFRKDVQEFSNNAKNMKFIIREFTYDEVEIKREKKERAKLLAEKEKTFSLYAKWLRVSLSDSYSALLHLKAVRVFVDSVLRYGLPVSFVALLLEATPKSIKKLRTVLNNLYGSLDSLNDQKILQELKDDLAINPEALALIGSQADYYPYVSFNIKTKFTD